ncbi:MFS transporter [Cupriavidus basilensis]
MAESEFGVPRHSFMLLVAFVVAFGFVKGAMNLVAGRLAERMGRKRVLLVGWLVALSIPPMVYFAPTWAWIVLGCLALAGLLVSMALG